MGIYQILNLTMSILYIFYRSLSHSCSDIAVGTGAASFFFVRVVGVAKKDIANGPARLTDYHREGGNCPSWSLVIKHF